MIDLIRFFQILFTSPKISRERLSQFASSHLSRLTANNPGGVFNAILASFTAAYTAFAGNLVDSIARNAALKSLNQAMNDSQRAVLEKIRELEPYIAYTYRNETHVILEFYPGGLTEYDNATQEHFLLLSQNFQNTVSDHSADFPADEVTALNTLMTTYITAIANEETAKGEVAGEREEVLDTRQKLCTELTRNVHTISLQFLGEQNKAAVYFDQSILDAAFANNSKAEGDLNAGETQNCFSNTSKPDTQYRIKLTTEGNARIAFKRTEDEAVGEAEGQEVVGGQDWILVTASNIAYSSDNKFLNITNTGTVTCTFIIERV